MVLFVWFMFLGSNYNWSFTRGVDDKHIQERFTLFFVTPRTERETPASFGSYHSPLSFTSTCVDAKTGG
jgi:hypothetical protein